MSAHRRCSNCEKSIAFRNPNGSIVISKQCKTTGEKIAETLTPKENSAFYAVRNCEEFLPRREYMRQFSTPLDTVRMGLDTTKELKDLIDI